MRQGYLRAGVTLTFLSHSTSQNFFDWSSSGLPEKRNPERPERTLEEIRPGQPSTDRRYSALAWFARTRWHPVQRSLTIKVLGFPQSRRKRPGYSRGARVFPHID